MTTDTERPIETDELLRAFSAYLQQQKTSGVDDDSGSGDPGDTVEEPTGKKPNEKKKRKKGKNTGQISSAYKESVLAEAFLQEFNAKNSGHSINVAELRLHLQRYNRENPRNRHPFKTKHGQLYVSTHGIDSTVLASQSVESSTNEDRKTNISYAALRTALIRRNLAGLVRSAYDLFNNKSALPVLDPTALLDHINMQLISNTAIRNSRGQFQFVTMDELLKLGTKKDTVYEVSENGVIVEMQDTFVASHKRSPQPQEIHPAYKQIFSSQGTSQVGSSINPTSYARIPTGYPSQRSTTTATLPNIATPAAIIESPRRAPPLTVNAPLMRLQNPQYQLTDYQELAIASWLQYYFEWDNSAFVGKNTFWAKLDKELTQGPFDADQGQVLYVIEKVYPDLAYNVVPDRKNFKVVGFKLRRQKISTKQPPTDNFACNLFIYWAFATYFLEYSGASVTSVETQTLVDEFVTLFSSASAFIENVDKTTMLNALRDQPFAKRAAKNGGKYLSLFQKQDKI